MKIYIVAISVLLIGYVLGVEVSKELNADTGEYCMSVYQTPEDISECLWILNRENN
jgi:hypothetical protein